MLIEDKVLQRAVAMEMEAVYEQDFYEFSYGFRPGKSAHQVLTSGDKVLICLKKISTCGHI